MVYCVVSGVLCGRTIQYMVGWCTMWYDCVMCGCAVNCVVGRCIMC